MRRQKMFNEYCPKMQQKLLNDQISRELKDELKSLENKEHLNNITKATENQQSNSNLNMNCDVKT